MWPGLMEAGKVSLVDWLEVTHYVWAGLMEVGNMGLYPCSSVWPGSLVELFEEEVKVSKRGKCKVNLIICAKIRDDKLDPSPFPVRSTQSGSWNS